MKEPVTHCIKKRPTNLLQATFLYLLSCCMVFVLSGENRVFSSILLHSQGTEQCNRDVQNNNVFFSTAGYSISRVLVDTIAINSSSKILQLFIITFPTILFPDAVCHAFLYSSFIPRAPPVC